MTAGMPGWRPTRAPLVGFVLPIVNGDLQAAEDVVQETMLRGWQHAGELRPEQAGSWLHKVARNIAISTYHRRRRARPREVPLDEATVPAAGDGLDGMVDALVIASALDSLSARPPAGHRRAVLPAAAGRRGRRRAVHSGGDRQVPLLLRPARPAQDAGGTGDHRTMTCPMSDAPRRLRARRGRRSRSGRAVRSHLEACADCRAELARLEPLPGLLAMRPAQPVAAADPPARAGAGSGSRARRPSHVTSSSRVARLESGRRPDQASRAMPWRALTATAAAAAAVGAAAGFWLAQPRRPPRLRPSRRRARTPPLTCTSPSR